MAKWQYVDAAHLVVKRELPEGGTQFRAAEGLDTEGILPEDPPVPEKITVSPWQIRKALNSLALRDAVETAVASADQETKDAWQYATEFERTHPLVISLGMALGKTEAELDALFALARSL